MKDLSKMSDYERGYIFPAIRLDTDGFQGGGVCRDIAAAVGADLRATVMALAIGARFVLG